jgi:hypothetical protein
VTGGVAGENQFEQFLCDQLTVQLPPKVAIGQRQNSVRLVRFFSKTGLSGLNNLCLRFLAMLSIADAREATILHIIDLKSLVLRICSQREVRISRQYQDLLSPKKHKNNDLSQICGPVSGPLSRLHRKARQSQLLRPTMRCLFWAPSPLKALRGKENSVNLRNSDDCLLQT